MTTILQFASEIRPYDFVSRHLPLTSFLNFWVHQTGWEIFTSIVWMPIIGGLINRAKLTPHNSITPIAISLIQAKQKLTWAAIDLFRL